MFIILHAFPVKEGGDGSYVVAAWKKKVNLNLPKAVSLDQQPNDPTVNW